MMLDVWTVVLVVVLPFLCGIAAASSEDTSLVIHLLIIMIIHFVLYVTLYIINHIVLIYLITFIMCY